MPLNAGEKKRRHIMNATIEVIADEGIDAVTHRRVGKQAGESHGVVGYHFPTRDSLIHETFKHYYGSINELMAESGWHPNKKMSLDQIVDALTAVISNELTNSKSTVVEMELLLVATRNKELNNLYQNWKNQGQDMFARGLAKSGYKDPKRLADIISHFMRGFLIERLTDANLTIEDYKERLKELLSMAPKDKL